MSTQIVILEQTREIEVTKVFTDEGMKALLAEIEINAKSLILDVTTAPGRKEIASWAYKIAKTKTAIDEVGKGMTDEWKKKAAEIDSVRKAAREFLDKLKDDIRKPLNEFEEAEEIRIKDRQERISKIEAFKNVVYSSDGAVKHYEKSIKVVQEYLEFDWQEFSFKANTVGEQTLEILNERFSAAKKYEEDQVELKLLKEQLAERARKDHDERIAKEAAEKARKEAEQEAYLKAKHEENLAKERERKIKEEKDAAERARVFAENRAKEAEKQAELAEQNRIESDKKAKEEIKRLGKEAAEKLQQSIKEKEEKERQELEARERNKKHCDKINSEAMEIIIKLISDAGLNHGADPVAKIIIEAIAKGEVPHLSIKY